MRMLVFLLLLDGNDYWITSCARPTFFSHFFSLAFVCFSKASVNMLKLTGHSLLIFLARILYDSTHFFLLHLIAHSQPDLIYCAKSDDTQRGIFYAQLQNYEMYREILHLVSCFSFNIFLNSLHIL